MMIKNTKHNLKQLDKKTKSSLRSPEILDVKMGPQDKKVWEKVRRSSG